MKRVWKWGLCLALIGLLNLSLLGFGRPAAAGTLTPGGDAGKGNLPGAIPELFMSVRYDYDDQVRTGVAVPAFVRIENRGEAVEGSLRLSVTPYGSEQAYTYEMPVYVGQESKADYTLPFCAVDHSQNIKVHLVQKNRVVAEATRARTKIQFSDKMLVGILSDNHAGMDYRSSLTSIMDENFSAVKVAPVDLKAEDLPEEAYLLDRFTLLILNHFDLNYLSEAQLAALTQWVRGGGSLLVDADPANRQAVESLEPIVQLQMRGELTGYTSAELLGVVPGWEDLEDGELQKLGNVYPPGELMVGSEEYPLIAGYPVERGRVFVTAFALNDPYLSHVDVSDLLRQIRGLSARDNDYLSSGVIAYNGTVNSAMSDAVKSIPWLDAPSLPWVVVILAAFILLAAPVSYFVLAKRDKRDWIWLTAPALALAFCAVIIGYGVGSHGTATVSSVVTYVDLRDNAQSARALSLVGIAAPRQGSYELSFEEELFPHPLLTRNYYYWYDYDDEERPAGRPAVRMDLSGQPKVTYDRIPQWSMESLYLHRELELEGGLEAVVWYQVDGMHFLIRNNTGYDLEDVSLISPQGHHRIPLLENGEAAEGVVQSYSYSYSYGSGIDARRITNELYKGEDADTRTEEEKREDYLKSRMINLMFEDTATASTRSYRASDAPLLWAWSREVGALPVTANGRTMRNDLNRALIVGATQITYEDNDELLIPVGQVAGIVVSTQDVVNGWAEIGERSAFFEDGEVTYALSLPERVKDFEIDEMVVLSFESTGDFTALLYNNRLKDWEEYELHATLWGDGAQDYIDADGTVLVKFTPAPDRNPAAYDSYISIDNLTIGVSGKEQAHAGD